MGVRVELGQMVRRKKYVQLAEPHLVACHGVTH